MLIFDRAELMKKANGTYFPEEVAIIFGPPFVAHYDFFFFCKFALTVVNILQKLLKWFAQLALAVDYLHSNFVLHRDLKVSDRE